MKSILSVDCSLLAGILIQATYHSLGSWVRPYVSLETLITLGRFWS